MNKKKIYNIIDFGSSKIRLSIYDNNSNENYSETILNNNTSISNGRCKELEDLIKRTEKKISYLIEDVIILVDSSKLFSIDISLSRKLDTKDSFFKTFNTIALEAKHIINSYYNNFDIVHITYEKYIINEKIYYEYFRDDKKIDNLKIDFKLICFPKNLISSIENIFNNINIKIVKIYSSSYVKTDYYLKKLNQKKTSFLEIGYDRSTFFIYENDRLRFVQSIPIGGHHITNDISKVFKISYSESEIIKKAFNKSETEFSYNKNDLSNNFSVKDIIDKKISINLLIKVILYRIQEILDFNFKKTKIDTLKLDLKDTNLFLIGDGSKLFNNNSFHLEDKFNFNSINFYSETDNGICKAGLSFYHKDLDLRKINKKKQGIFERFFNFVGK